MTCTMYKIFTKTRFFYIIPSNFINITCFHSSSCFIYSFFLSIKNNIIIFLYLLFLNFCSLVKLKFLKFTLLVQVLSEQYLLYFIPASTKIKSFFFSFFLVGRA